MRCNIGWCEIYNQSWMQIFFIHCLFKSLNKISTQNFFSQQYNKGTFGNWWKLNLTRALLWAITMILLWLFGYLATWIYWYLDIWIFGYFEVGGEIGELDLTRALLWGQNSPGFLLHANQRHHQCPSAVRKSKKLRNLQNCRMLAGWNCPKRGRADLWNHMCPN